MSTPIEQDVPVSVPLYAGPPLVTAERSAIASPIGWSAILAGATVAVGVWLVLHMLGIGIGLIAIDPDDAGTLRGVGIGAGIWSALAPLFGLFVGGLVAGRVAPTINSANAAIHGAVVWALTGIASLILLATAVSSVVQGTAAAGAAVGRGAAAAEQAKRAALEAAEITGQVLLVLSVLMILGLGASIAGAVVSVRRERREHVVLPRAQTTVRTAVQ